MSDLVGKGIAALKAGDKALARRLLQEAIRQNPADVQAWLWLSGAVDTDKERAFCLQQVLRLDPNHQAAARGLAQLVARGAVSLQPGSESSSQTSAPVSPVADSRSPSLSRPQPSTARTAAGVKARKQSAREEVVFETHPSLAPVALACCTLALMVAAVIQWNLIAPGVFRVIFALFVFVALIRIIQETWSRLFTRYTLTTEHLVIQKGWIARTRRVIPVRHIQDVIYQQSILQRLLGIGDLFTESAGEQESAAQLRDIAHCHKRSELILQVAQQAKVKGG